MLIVKYSSIVMQRKRMLCECHTRFFLDKVKKWNKTDLNIIVLLTIVVNSLEITQQTVFVNVWLSEKKRGLDEINISAW